MMIPKINTTAEFYFAAPFNVLDGIYTLTHTMRFESALEDGVNFLDSLYTPAGLTQTEFDADWTAYQQSIVLKLVSVEDPTVILYVPESLLAKVPDPQIIKCHDYYLAIDVGVFQDPASLTYIRDQLNDMAASVTGTLKTAKIFSTKTVWMTKSDYDTLEAERAVRIQGLTLPSVTITQQNSELARLRTLVNQYRNTLVAMRSGA